jgi:hypothetical protein
VNVRCAPRGCNNSARVDSQHEIFDGQSGKTVPTTHLFGDRKTGLIEQEGYHSNDPKPLKRARTVFRMNND